MSIPHEVLESRDGTTLKAIASEMTMAKPPKWMKTLQASREEAMLAVNLYNTPSEPRSFEGFVVHMHLAWLYLLHAKFTRDPVDHRYRDLDNPRLLQKIDGEVKLWELARCVRHHWPMPENAVRVNLEYFIALRNKTEHRYTSSNEYLALASAGKAQALLLNYEQELTSLFGQSYSMATVIRFPVFVGTFTLEGEKTLRELRSKLPSDLQRFMTEFHSGLPEGVADDPAFEMRLRIVLERANRNPNALAMEFLRWNDMTEDQREAAVALGRRGQTIIREQVRPVANADLIRLSDVAARVNQAIPYHFRNHHGIAAWQTQGIRPPPKSINPERTTEQYCIYESLSKSYGYTEAWVSRVIERCSTAAGFEEFTGCRPTLKTDPLPSDQGTIDIPDEAIAGDSQEEVLSPEVQTIVVLQDS